MLWEAVGTRSPTVAQIGTEPKSSSFNLLGPRVLGL